MLVIGLCCCIRVAVSVEVVDAHTKKRKWYTLQDRKLRAGACLIVFNASSDIWKKRAISMGNSIIEVEIKSVPVPGCFVPSEYSIG